MLLNVLGTTNRRLALKSLSCMLPFVHPFEGAALLPLGGFGSSSTYSQNPSRPWLGQSLKIHK